MNCTAFFKIWKCPESSLKKKEKENYVRAFIFFPLCSCASTCCPSPLPLLLVDQVCFFFAVCLFVFSDFLLNFFLVYFNQERLRVWGQCFKSCSIYVVLGCVFFLCPKTRMLWSSLRFSDVSSWCCLSSLHFGSSTHQWIVCFFSSHLRGSKRLKKK